MTVQPGTVTIIRGGRLLDARPPRRSRRHSRHRRHHHRDRPARLAAPPARWRSTRGHAAASRVDQRPHARPRQPGQGHGRPLDARALPPPRRDQRQRSAEDRSQRQDRRGRDGAQGRHRSLRFAARAPRADARGRAVAGPRLCRRRDARRDRADGRRPHDVRGDPRPDGRPEPGAARGRRQAPARAVEDQHRRHARGTARMDARSPADRARGGADHPAPLLGRVHPRLRGLAGVRRPA